MMKLLLVLQFVLLTANIFACDCKTLSKEKEYQISDFIFMGQVISVSDTSFEVYVQEVFKGDNVEYTKISIEDCSIYPKRGELWLMYSEQRGNKFYVSHCGWSRSFNNPFSIYSENIPGPPPIGEMSNNSFAIQDALKELQDDILNLRNIREADKSPSTNLYYPWILLGFVILGSIILFFILNGKKYFKGRQ